MIYGIGTDIVEIERMRRAVERWGERFLKRIFTQGEIFYCYSKRDPFPHLAARFGAKEAMIKALTGAGPGGILKYTDIEVVNELTGRPRIKGYGALGTFLEDPSITIHLTIAHERSTATATIVLERKMVLEL